MPQDYLSDDEVFGAAPAAKYLSDDEVFGKAAAPKPELPHKNFAPAMPRADYEKEFDRVNPDAAPEGRALAMEAFDKQQAASRPASPIKLPGPIDTPEQFFEKRLNKRLQGKQNGVVPQLPAMVKPAAPPAPSSSSTIDVGGESLKAGVVSVAASLARAPGALSDVVEGMLAKTNEMAQEMGMPEWMTERKFFSPLQLLNPVISGADVNGVHYGGTNDVAAMIKQLGSHIENEKHARAVAGVGVKSNQALDAAIATGDFTQVKDVLSDPKSWAVAFGQAAPSLVVAVLGGIPAMAALEGGSAADRIDEFKAAGGEVDSMDGANAIIQKTVVNTLLEKLGLDAMMGKLPDSVRKKLIGEVVDGLGGRLVRGATGATIGAVTEGVTEGLQSFNENLAARHYDSTQNLTDGMLASVMGGTSMGGPVGGVHGAIRPSNNELIAAEIQRGVDGAQFTDADAIARARLAPRSANFTPEGSATQQAGLPDLVIPIQPQGAPDVRMPSDAGRMAAGGSAGPGADLNGGMAGSGLPPLDQRGGVVRGAEQADPANGQAGLQVDGAGQPAPGLERLNARATDADLLAGVQGVLDAPAAPAEPVVMMGRSKAGYATEQDATVAMQAGQKRSPEMAWTIEPIDGGKFRVVGKQREAAGAPIDKEWTAFSEGSGTLGIPRAEMPQVKAEHRGALANFLNARGIASAQETVPADSLKPTQAEFSPDKVQKAKDYVGGDRSILISADGHVLDGHHQWMAKKDTGADVKVIRLNAPIQQLLEAVKEFPSVERAPGAQATTANPTLAPDGQPFKTEAGAQLYAKQQGNITPVILSYNGGFGIAPQEAANGQGSGAAGPAVGGQQGSDTGAASTVRAGSDARPVAVDSRDGPESTAGTPAGDGAPTARPASLPQAIGAPAPIAEKAMRVLEKSGYAKSATTPGPRTDAQYAASAIGRMLGKTVTFFKSEQGGKSPNAFMIPGQDRHIYVADNATDAPIKLVFHEAVHGLTTAHKRTLIKRLGETFDQSRRDEFMTQFDYENLSEAQVDEEIAAFITQAVSGREDFLVKFKEKLKDAEFREAIAALVSHMKSIITRAQANGNMGNEFLAKYVTDVERAIDLVSSAMAEVANDNSSTNQGGVGVTSAAPSVVTSQREADFTDPESRSEVSTAQPTAKPDRKTGYQPNSYTEKRVIDAEDIKASPAHVQRIVDALRTYNTLTAKGNNNDVLKDLHDTVVDNLLWLHDKVTPEARDRAKLWYDGANKIANELAENFSLSPNQTSGILAVFSPQMDWFKNVSLGERAITIISRHGDEAWSSGMSAWAESWLKSSSTVAEKLGRSKDVARMREIASEGRPLNELSKEDAALFIRAFDEAYYPRSYRLVTPEGGLGAFVQNDDGKEASVTWGGFGTIEKAVSIYRDGSFKNIDVELGGEHKVRNFYNNIVAPNSKDGHVTIDTHAVAAAFVKALSGTSTEVKHNLGGLGSTASTGASGSYALFADAYRDAASQRGILAREMQSITWEAVRALFPASLKGGLSGPVNEIWDRVKAGELTREEAREEISKISGGIRSFAWEGGGTGRFVKDGATSFNSAIANDPDLRDVSTKAPKNAKDSVRVSLAAATSTIPGVKELYERASSGDLAAHALLQDIALDSLQNLLGSTSAAIKADPVTGLYGGASEPALGLTISFTDTDQKTVLAALAQFADNFNQEQVHVRQETKSKPGTVFDDGSYATPVYRWELSKTLSTKQIQKVIDQSGLYGLTFGDTFVEAYYVGDPKDEREINTFHERAGTASGLLGKATSSVSAKVARLWPYGDGAGTIGFDRIRGELPAGSQAVSKTAKRVAEYLAGSKVKTFDQPGEVTSSQAELQREIGDAYESLPDNDLKNPRVRKAYTELGKEVLKQFKALPVKVDMMIGNGEPYKTSDAMRRDILDNNHLSIFATTPETFGPPDVDFSEHPLLADSGLKDQAGNPMLYNDLLRAVHDYYAHSMSATQFGAKGEEAAWKNHMSMTTNPWARWALTAETRGQNSWVNFRSGLDQSIPAKDRPFARQKAVLLPVGYSMTGDRAVDSLMKEFAATLPAANAIGTKPSAGVTASNRVVDPLEDIPPAFVRRHKVPHDVYITDEDVYETIDVSADKALASVREDIESLRALLDCMRGVSA